MAGRRQEPQPFNPPGIVLFRLRFNVGTANSGDFSRFIRQVEQQIGEHIHPQRNYGMGTMELPPRCLVNQNERRWIVIELENQERIVPCFIEGETIYLRGYQNQEGEVFEFKREAMDDNDPTPLPYLGSASTSLGFGCNYHDMIGRSRGAGDPGLTLEACPGGDRKLPNFGKERLQDAVNELAQGRNLPGQSNHKTAQSLLLVCIRICESIRNRSVRREMAVLWDVRNSTGQPSRNLSSNCLGQIRNWNNIGSRVQRSFRVPKPPETPSMYWTDLLTKATGLESVSDAKDVLVLVLFNDFSKEDKYPDEPGHQAPRWRAPDNNNNGRRGGPGGAAGGVLAAELPAGFRFPVREEPVMRILGVYVRCGAGCRIEGVHGSVTVTDGLGAQTIYRRTRDNYQRRNSGDSDEMMRLELNVLDRPVSAYDCWDIDVDLWSASGDQLSAGSISWSICNFSSNTYDRVMRRTIGQAVVEYVVYSVATEQGAQILGPADDGVTIIEFVPTSPMAPQDPSSLQYQLVDHEEAEPSDPTPPSSSSAGGYKHDEL